MKTPEEWLSVWANTDFLLTDFAKAIQQDAYLAGLKKASEIAEETLGKPEYAYEYGTNVASKVRDAILAEMDRVKAK